MRRELKAEPMLKKIHKQQTKGIRSKIQAAETTCLRKIKEITIRDRTRNKMVRREFKVEPTLKKIHKQQLRWFGHLMRMNNSRPVNKLWQAKMTEEKGGRESWENTIADIPKEKTVTWSKANKKARNKKEKAEFTQEKEEYYLTPERVKHDKESWENTISDIPKKKLLRGARQIRRHKNKKERAEFAQE